jgi:hypothetical protein
MANPLSRLSTAPTHSYRIERELGAGQPSERPLPERLNGDDSFKLVASALREAEFR